MSTVIAFTPDPTISWLRNDPDMQTRDAFAETKVVTLNQEFDGMGTDFPGGTQLLFKRIYSPSDLVEGAVYACDEWNIPFMKGSWRTKRLMGRLAKIGRVKHSLNYPFAELAMTFDNPEMGKAFGSNASGYHLLFVHFKGYQVTQKNIELRGEEWAKMMQAYHCQLWQITHYISPPSTNSVVDTLHCVESGMSTKQQQWLDEEQQIAAGKATMVTARSKGFDYAPTLEQQLDAETASLIDNLLSEIPAIPAGRVHRSKGTIVALTRRSSERTTTEFYSQEAIHTVLDLLDSLHREQAAMAALRSRVAEQVAKRHAVVQAQSQAASDKVRQELALAI